MKATVEAKALRTALATISKVQASRSVLPVLDMIHVAAREDGLELQATDLHRWGSVRVECDVSEEGRTLIRADGLVALAEHASGEMIEFAGNGEGPYTARGGSASVILPTLSVSDWPLFEDIESAGEVEVPASVMRDALAATAWAASTEDVARPHLACVHFREREGHLTVEATSGHVLGRYDSRIEVPAGLSLMIARQDAPLLATMAKCAGDKDVRLRWDRRWAEFAAGHETLRVSQKERKYPDLDRVTPDAADSPVTAELEATSVARACELAVSVMREDFFRLQVDLYDGRALFRFDSTDRGGYEEALAADVQGDITFAVNAVYLRQIARSVGGRMILRLSEKLMEATRPIRIEPVDGNPVVFVVSPLRAEHSIPRPDR